MPDDIIPPLSESTSDTAPESSALNLTQEQLDSLGLSDCQPGESYTVSLKCTSNDGGLPAFEASGPAVPDESSDLPDLDDESDDAVSAPPIDDEELGMPKREPRSFRPGLNDTKKMRDL